MLDVKTTSYNRVIIVIIIVLFILSLDLSEGLNGGTWITLNTSFFGSVTRNSLIFVRHFNTN